MLSNPDIFPRDSENDGELAFEEEQIFEGNNEVEEKEEEEDSVDRAMDLHAKMT